MTIIEIIPEVKKCEIITNVTANNIWGEHGSEIKATVNCVGHYVISRGHLIIENLPVSPNMNFKLGDRLRITVEKI